MLSTQTALLRLSQRQLNLLERCPRQFQHIYLDQLASPLNPEQEERQTLGKRFHLLMQQRELGLPIHTLLQEDPQLQQWMAAVANVAPKILVPPADNETFRDSEHCRTLQFQDYLLTVVYDLLIADNQQAQILDWKTYPQPPEKYKLQQNWQTRLYLYVLVETSEYQPEDISMTYWFVQSEGKPQSMKFSYNTAQHQQTEKKLNQLLSQLTNYLESYHQGKQFLQVAEDSGACDYCQFATRCDRIQETQQAIAKNSLPNLTNIQEVSL